MEKLPKIPVGTITDESLAEIKAIAIGRCKKVYQTFPASTKVYVAMKTGLSITFISNNWEQIIK